MRIAPRSLLCGSAWRAGGTVADTGFDELRELCTDADSQIPFVMGMAGSCRHCPSMHAFGSPPSLHRVRRANRSLGDRTLTVALLFAAIYAECLAGSMRTSKRLAQRVIDLADGDATMGNVLTGSPLAFATVMRAIARCCLGEDGWRADFDDANRIAHQVDPTTFVSTVMFKYVTGIALGALVPDANALAETSDALDIRAAIQRGHGARTRPARARHDPDPLRPGVAQIGGLHLLGRARDLAMRNGSR